MATQEFSHSLPMLLYRALAVVMPRFRKIFNDFGLTEQQWRVLRVLWEQGRISFGELAGITRIPGPSLVGVIDRLGKAGLVERQRSDADRRHVLIRATREGQALEKKVRPRVGEAYAALQASVGGRDWQQLIDALERLTALGEDDSTGEKPTTRAGRRKD